MFALKGFKLKLDERLLEHLFSNTSKAISFTAILAILIIGYLTHEGLPIQHLWIVILSIILIFRFIISMIAQRDPHFIVPAYFLLVLSGLFLGGLLGFFYAYFHDAMSVREQTILLLFFTGLSAGSTISMAASPLAFLSFSLALFLPIIFKNLGDSNTDTKFVAIILVIYLGYLIIIYSTNRNMLRKNINLLQQQEDLNKKLEEFNQKLSFVSMTDELTGLANRRYFQERFIADWIRAKRALLPISLVIIDVDYFKECNDNYGHLYGDECLKEIAKTIGKQIKRRTDLAARYGGDELVIILYNTSLAATEQFAQKIKKNIDGLNIKHEYSPIADHITVSIGIANTIPKISDDYETLFARADKALYEAKSNGRNCISVAKYED